MENNNYSPGFTFGYQSYLDNQGHWQTDDYNYRGYLPHERQQPQNNNYSRQRGQNNFEQQTPSMRNQPQRNWQNRNQPRNEKEIDGLAYRAPVYNGINDRNYNQNYQNSLPVRSGEGQYRREPWIEQNGPNFNQRQDEYNRRYSGYNRRNNPQYSYDRFYPEHENENGEYGYQQIHRQGWQRGGQMNSRNDDYKSLHENKNRRQERNWKGFPPQNPNNFSSYPFPNQQWGNPEPRHRPFPNNDDYYAGGNNDFDRY